MDPSVEIDHIEDPILRIIEQCKNYPSIVAIHDKNLNKQFSFEYIPKSYYRPVSILPNLSKVFERCSHKQISDFFDTILSKYQCGFRKGHGAQHCLIALLEKWREKLDRELEFGILLTDFSKAFDCLPHNLFIA